MHKNKRCWLLTVFLTALAGTPSIASAASGLAQLNSLETPGRQHNNQLQRSMNSVTGDGGLVHMQQGSFRLDPNYTVQFASDQGYVLIQLTGQLTAPWRTQLEAQGVVLLQYIPDNTWISRIDRGAIDTLRSLAFIKAIGQLYPIDKLPSSLLSHDLSARAFESGNLSLEVTFHQDQSFNQVLEQLRALGAATQQTDFGSGKRLLITLPEDKLLPLVNLDCVSWIEEPPSPKADQNIDAAALVGVSALQTTLPDLQGDNINIGAWEGANPDANHPDLAGRIFIIESGSTSNHATHVSGTLSSVDR